MTAKRIEAEVWDDGLPVPPWVRPLSPDEQEALLKEAEDEFERGEGIPHEVVKAEIALMIAQARAAGPPEG